MSVVVLAGITAAVAVAGAMTQITHIIIWNARVVFGTESSRYAALTEVLSGRTNRVTTVAPDPSVADEQR